MPAGKVASGKLAQTLAYGARCLQVRGDFDAAMRLVREACDALGIYLVNSINPFRIEGQKTIVWELLQDLDWQPPDWIVVPAGNLGNTSAFGKALREAHAWGWIDRLPRLAAVQASGADPFYRSFAEGFAHRHRVTAETVASAIRIGDPVSHERAVAAIRDTRGVVTEVTDEELMAAKRRIDGMGIGCEPASATTLAGVERLRRGRRHREGRARRLRADRPRAEGPRSGVAAGRAGRDRADHRRRRSGAGALSRRDCASPSPRRPTSSS